MITIEQCDEIIHLVSKHCCCHCSPFYCSEVEACEIQDIFEILSRNVEKEPVKEEEEKLLFDYGSDDELL
jgi:hypothetical protein